MAAKNRTQTIAMKRKRTCDAAKMMEGTKIEAKMIAVLRFVRGLVDKAISKKPSEVRKSFSFPGRYWP